MPGPLFPLSSPLWVAASNFAQKMAKDKQTQNSRDQSCTFQGRLKHEPSDGHSMKKGEHPRLVGCGMHVEAQSAGTKNSLPEPVLRYIPHILHYPGALMQKMTALPLIACSLDSAAAAKRSSSVLKFRDSLPSAGRQSHLHETLKFRSFDLKGG